MRLILFMIDISGHKLVARYLHTQHAKKVVSDTPGLVNFAIQG